MQELLRIYSWPSQSYWRYFELSFLRTVVYQAPILEIGCGDGGFTGLVLEHVALGIDVNPKAIDQCRRAHSGLYGELRCMDARQLEGSDQARYGTVFANSVLEHIPQLAGVLRASFGALYPGGRLVTTVPFAAMSDHLRFASPRYVEARQRELQHLNLWSPETWRETLQGIGFDDVQITPCLTPEQCEFWDSIDRIGCWGLGRYRLAPVVQRLAPRLVPGLVRTWALNRMAEALSKRLGPAGTLNSACVGAIVARKPLVDRQC